MSTLTPGTTVRIVMSRAGDGAPHLFGAIASPDSTRFVETVEAGTEGVYDCPHPTLPDWHLVMFDHPDHERVIYVPLHVDQIEVVE